MNIVILDGYTLNPGDLSWESLRSLGECTIHDRTALNDIVARARNSDIILTNKVPLTREILAQLPALKYICVLATGYNVVDIRAAKERGILVSNIPAYSTHSVAQLVFALLLELTHRTGDHSNAVRQGRWSSNPDFSFWDVPLIELKGKTFGIVGFGNIGKAVAAIASSFEMKVMISTRSRHSSAESKFEFTDTESIFRQSDVVSLHCALTDETYRLVNTARLSAMKQSAYLLNTGRGDLVDERALADALNRGAIAGAGLDVLSSEPPSKENPLLTAKNCIITPHIAWATLASRQRLMDTAVSNVRAFINKRPINVVS